MWTEFVVPRGAETVWTYADGLTAGHPAVTRHRLGEGIAWYVSTRLGAQGLDALIGWAADDARIAPRADLPRDVEVVRRTGESGTYLFAINHTASDAKVPLEAHGTELLTGERAAGRLARTGGRGPGRTARRLSRFVAFASAALTRPILSGPVPSFRGPAPEPPLLERRRG